MQNQALRRTYAHALVFLLAVAAVPAQLPELIPRAALLGNAGGSSPRLSPDGKLVAWVQQQGGTASLYARPIAEHEARLIASDRRNRIDLIGWQNDSMTLLYRQDREGDGVWHIYQTQVVSMVTRDLTPILGASADLVEAHTHTPHQLLVELALPGHGAVDVFRISLITGAMEPDTVNPGGATRFVTCNDMQIRAMLAAQPGGGGDLRVRAAANQPWRSVLTWNAGDSVPRVVGFNHENSAMWVLSDAGAPAVRLLEIAMADGKTHAVAEDPRFDVTDVLIHPKTDVLQAVRFLRERAEWQVVDPEIKGDFDALTAVKDGEWDIVARDAEDKLWVVACSEDDGPTQYSTMERPARKLRRLASELPALDRYRFGKTRAMTVKARDGMMIPCYLTLPPGLEPKGLPMVVKIHAGPWTRDAWGLDTAVQWLANRGYAVLQVNFRGSSGYGRAHLEAGNHEWGGKMTTDVIDAKNWVVEQGIANPKKIGLFGESFGGYTALTALSATPDEFACAVAAFAPTNLITLVRAVPPTWASLRDIFDRRVGNAEKDEALLRTHSPLFNAGPIKAPVLLVAGGKDLRAPSAETAQFVEGLRKAGKAADYLLFEDEGHGIARASNRLKFHAAAEDFLAKHLGGRAEPASAKEKADDVRK